MSSHTLRPCTTTHFQITAERHPAALPKILSVFERQDILPDLIRSSKFGSGTLPEGRLVIDAHIQGLDPAQGRLVTEKLNALVSVLAVRSEVILARAAAAKAA